MAHSITFGFLFKKYNSVFSYDPWDAIVQYKDNDNNEVVFANKHIAQGTTLSYFNSTKANLLFPELNKRWYEKMGRSVLAGDLFGYNTFDDWHLIPTTQPVISPPTVKTQLIDLPAGDGYIDLSETVNLKPNYGNRQGSWSFIIDPDFKNMERPENLCTRIAYFLHNKKLDVVLEDEPMYYYTGRFKVNTVQSGANWHQITIEYTLEPYKRERLTSIDDWRWDIIDFTKWNNLQSQYYGIQLNDTTPVEIIVKTGDETISPIITARGDGCRFEFYDCYDREYDGFFSGTHSQYIPRIKMFGDYNKFIFEGDSNSSIVDIEFRSGWL